MQFGMYVLAVSSIILCDSPQIPAMFMPILARDLPKLYYSGIT